MPQKSIPNPGANAQTPFIKHKSAHTRPSKNITLVSFLLNQPEIQELSKMKNTSHKVVFTSSSFQSSGDSLLLNITGNPNYPSLSTLLIIVCGAFKDSTSQASANTFLPK